MKSSVAVIAGFVAAVSTASVAQAVQPPPASPCAGFSDCLLVYQNGVLNTDLSIFVTESQEAQNGANYIYASTLAPDPTQFGFATVFAESGVPVSSGYSDIVGVASDGTNYFLGFASDTETQLVNYGNSSNFTYYTPEPGYPVSVTQYLSPTLQGEGYTASFSSDVPEPATWLLMLAGFGALGFAGWRRKVAVDA